MTMLRSGTIVAMGGVAASIFSATGLDDAAQWAAPITGRTSQIDALVPILGPRRLRQILVSCGLRYPQLRLIEGGEEMATSAYTTQRRYRGSVTTGWIDPDRVSEAWRRGAMLVFQSLHQYDTHAASLHREFARLVRFDVRLNVYVAPPRARGLGLHHDAHDVLVVQLDGERSWTWWETFEQRPLPTAKPSFTSDPARYRRTVEARSRTEQVLSPGNVIFLPAGTPHLAETVGVASTHLTVSLHRPSLADLALRLAHQAARSPTLRRAAPALKSEALEASVLEAQRILVRELGMIEPSDLEEIPIEAPGILETDLEPGLFTESVAGPAEEW